MSEAMKHQCSEAFNILPSQWTEKRRDHANGFSPETDNNRFVKLSRQVDQIHGVAPISHLLGGDVPPGSEPIVKLELGLSQRQPRSLAEA